MNWFIAICISVMFLACVDLLYKFTDCCTLETDMFICLLFIFSGLIAIIYYFTKYNKQILNNLKVKKNIVFVVFLIALLNFFGNIFYFNSLKNVSNPVITRTAYSGLIILLIGFFGVVIFKKKLLINEYIGIFLIIAGMVFTTKTIV